MNQQLSLRPPLSALDCSVIVVSWNTRDLLSACLASLFEHTRSVTFEAIVVDNASSDGTCDMLAQDFPDVIVIENDTNDGFACGCNQGMRVAQGRVFVLLNSDTRLIEDAIGGCVRDLESDAGLGVMAPALVFDDGAPQPSCGRFPTVWGSVRSSFDLLGLVQRIRDRRSHFVSPYLTQKQHEVRREVDWVLGACVIVRREAVADAGLLDETIFLFAEEWDWEYRIREAGWRIMLNPDRKLVHVGSASWALADGARVAAVLRGMHYFYRKHYGRGSALRFTLFTCLVATAKVVGCLPLLLIPGMWTSAWGGLRCNLAKLRWCLSRAT
ncbi:MAG: glycosyl transferase [Planctomycetes bacterium]|nr:glycosyl transferase [Planctomycetota bacterium]